jgi:hypothetical protein
MQRGWGIEAKRALEVNILISGDKKNYHLRGGGGGMVFRPLPRLLKRLTCSHNIVLHLSGETESTVQTFINMKQDSLQKNLLTGKQLLKCGWAVYLLPRVVFSGLIEFACGEVQELLLLESGTNSFIFSQLLLIFSPIFSFLCTNIYRHRKVCDRVFAYDWLLA